MIPVMKHHLAMPSDIIDLAAIDEIKGIKVSGNHVSIGAITSHATVASSKSVKKAVPALAELANTIITLFDDSSKIDTMVSGAMNVMKDNKGAIDNILQLIKPLIKA